MNQLLDDLSEQAAELGQSIKKSFINDVVKGIPQVAKQQIRGNDNSQQSVDNGKDLNKDNKANQTNKTNKSSNSGMDPVTGKPVPSKRALTQLNDATKKLAFSKLQKIREELDKQRMKVKDEERKENPEQGNGPEIKKEEKKPNPNAISQTLKQSQGTGEFKGSVGG